MQHDFYIKGSLASGGITKKRKMLDIFSCV